MVSDDAGSILGLSILNFCYRTFGEDGRCALCLPSFKMQKWLTCAEGRRGWSLTSTFERENYIGDCVSVDVIRSRDPKLGRRRR